MQTVPLFPQQKITKHTKTHVTFSTANNELNIQYSYHCQDTSGTRARTQQQKIMVFGRIQPKKFKNTLYFSDHTSDIQLHYFNIIFF